RTRLRPLTSSWYGFSHCAPLWWPPRSGPYRTEPSGGPHSPLDEGGPRRGGDEAFEGLGIGRAAAEPVPGQGAVVVAGAGDDHTQVVGDPSPEPCLAGF